MPGVTITVTCFVAALLQPELQLPSSALLYDLAGVGGRFQGCGMSCTLLQSIYPSDCLSSSLSFVKFTAMSRKMSSCSGAAGFHATHLRCICSIVSWDNKCARWYFLHFWLNILDPKDRKLGKIPPCDNQGKKIQCFSPGEKAWAGHLDSGLTWSGRDHS